MNQNRRLSSALLLLMVLSSHVFSIEDLRHKVEILSPLASEQYFENTNIQFQIETNAEAFRDSVVPKQILWRITSRFTGETFSLAGNSVSMSFEESIYDIELLFRDTNGAYNTLAQSGFGVLRKPDLSLVVSKERRRGLWFFSGNEAHLAWTGAGSEVEIYRKKSCGEGFTRRQNCEAGFQKVYTGKNTGSFTYPYHKDDYYQICNLGAANTTRISGLLIASRANDSCSFPVIVPRR